MITAAQESDDRFIFLLSERDAGRIKRLSDCIIWRSNRNTGLMENVYAALSEVGVNVSDYRQIRG